ncbi:hypothetical protein [Mycoplasma sp. P36-A1]|uniref:hypothetical protein n=1 Tax=Mycoplasma sp. P36-A1 TaxID=3252900 RepID=UPI003C2F1377
MNDKENEFVNLDDESKKGKYQEYFDKAKEYGNKTISNKQTQKAITTVIVMGAVALLKTLTSRRKL